MFYVTIISVSSIELLRQLRCVTSSLEPDRSCAKCGEKDVQVTPLQAQVVPSSNIAIYFHLVMVVPDGAADVHLVYRGTTVAVRSRLRSISTTSVLFFTCTF